MDDNLWYAVNQTRVLFEPKQGLETFGVSRVPYTIVSELLDKANAVRIREGVIISEKPTIITPQHYAQQVLDGFGSDAQEYADWLTQNGKFLVILQYGMQIRKEETTEQIVHAPVQQILDQVTAELESEKKSGALIHGVDEFWEVSLLKFMQGYIQTSFPNNLHEIQQRQIMHEHENSRKFRVDIENSFYEARGNKDAIMQLGEKLKRLHVFEEYEDRFYALLRECE